VARREEGARGREKHDRACVLCCGGIACECNCCIRPFPLVHGACTGCRRSFRLSTHTSRPILMQENASCFPLVVSMLFRLLCLEFLACRGNMYLLQLPRDRRDRFAPIRGFAAAARLRDRLPQRRVRAWRLGGAGACSLSATAGHCSPRPEPVPARNVAPTTPAGLSRPTACRQLVQRAAPC
jgi:hypothetical protein